MAFIEVKNLSFSYPLALSPSLKDISFEVEKGEICLVEGLSGSGKTTLLRHFCSALLPNGIRDGEVLIGGKSVFNKDKDLPTVGFLGQSVEGQIVTDSVMKELFLAPENLGLKWATSAKRAAEATACFSLESILNLKTDELSDGQKQRLNLASLFTLFPRVLVLDEPLLRLDKTAARQLISHLNYLSKGLNITVIICEHLIEDLLPLCDRLVVLEKGSLACSITSKSTLGYDGVLSDECLADSITSPLIRAFKGVKTQNKIPFNTKAAVRLLSDLPKREDLAVRDDEKRKAKNTDQKGDCVLSACSVFFRYNRYKNDVLRGVDIKLFEGQIHCLLGSNGSGKSTLLRVLSGLNRHYNGKIRVLNKPIEDYKNGSLYEKNLSILLDNHDAYLCHDTVKEELDSMQKASEEKERLVKIMSLEELSHQHPLDLSFGQRQRLALAKVLLTKPRILLLDEPTKGLDYLDKEKLLGLVKELNKSGVAILIATHDLDFASDCADTVSVIFDGQVIEKDDAYSFFNNSLYYTTQCNLVARSVNSDAYNERGLKAYLEEYYGK